MKKLLLVLLLFSFALLLIGCHEEKDPLEENRNLALGIFNEFHYNDRTYVNSFKIFNEGIPTLDSSITTSIEEHYVVTIIDDKNDTKYICTLGTVRVY